ncbi:hypothetical protein H5410_051772 [Solanum commersonii]|uniref:Uncharacterized protein n=1 Tax=Solanum commersonii TaxID=4109 RepID=A0A9J5WZ12_SOLCO|nr:hypothetical protein H5410_051772 [Solanum commersonii]
MPLNTEKEACKVNNTSRVKPQELIEIDPPLIFDMNTARHIMNKITQNLKLARSLVNGNGVSLDLWDITEKNDMKKYEDKNFTFRKLCNDDYFVSIAKLIKDFELGVGDEIGLYWYPYLSKLIFKLFCKVRDSRIRPVFWSRACKINNTPHEVTRELVEIRDLYPAPRIDLQNPWKIKKKITHGEIIVGMLMIPFLEMFEYILRYWTLDVAKSLESGCKVCVDMWDVTEENIPKKYVGGSVWFRKLFNGDFYLWSIELFKGRVLGDGNEIGLYWDPRSSTLVFKLLSQLHFKAFIRGKGLLGILDGSKDVPAEDKEKEAWEADNGKNIT